MTEGHRRGKIFDQYVDALSEFDRLPGKPKSEEQLVSEIADLKTQEAEESGLRRVRVIQKLEDAEYRLKMLRLKDEIPELQKEFVAWGAEYAEQQGFSYDTLTTAGIPGKVLDEAGIEPPSARRGRRRT